MPDTLNQKERDRINKIISGVAESLEEVTLALATNRQALLKRLPESCVVHRTLQVSGFATDTLADYLSDDADG